MNAWGRLRKSLENTKNKSLFAISKDVSYEGTVFSSRKSLFRWALAVNMGALLLALIAKSVRVHL
jgi:hypothetical protein